MEVDTVYITLSKAGRQCLKVSSGGKLVEFTVKPQ